MPLTVKCNLCKLSTIELMKLLNEYENIANDSIWCYFHLTFFLLRRQRKFTYARVNITWYFNNFSNVVKLNAKMLGSSCPHTTLKTVFFIVVGSHSIGVERQELHSTINNVCYFVLLCSPSIPILRSLSPKEKSKEKTLPKCICVFIAFFHNNSK